MYNFSMKKHKRGDIREDGMVFIRYQKCSHNGEYWVTPEKFSEIKERECLSNKRKRDRLQSDYNNYPRTLKCGDIRGDGMVFWKYNITSKNFEQWVTPEKIKSFRHNRNKLQRKRADVDPLFRLIRNTSRLINNSISRNGYKKESKTHEILGCSFVDFKKHLESQFAEGMTWDNQGEWHIDHRIPHSAGKTEEEVLKLNHHSNLQPMWWRPNIIKSDSYCPKELKEYLCA
jgi:hypothetical protein